MGKDVDVSLEEFDLDITSSMDSNNTIALTGNPDLPITVNPLSVDLGLNNVNVDLGLDDVNVDLGLNDVNVDMGLDNINMCMSFVVKELPSMRVHFPVDLDFGLKILGIPIFNFGIFGKAMVVTEDNPKKIFYTPKKYTGQFSKKEASASESIKVSIDEK